MALLLKEFPPTVRDYLKSEEGRIDDLLEALFVDGHTPYVMVRPISVVVDEWISTRTSGVVTWDSAHPKYREEAVRDVLAILEALAIRPLEEDEEC